jgi:hypothetical protein
MNDHTHTISPLAIPNETRYMWLDKNGEVAGPLHETIKSAVNYRVNWKQIQGKQFGKVYGAGLTPITMKKVIVKFEFLDDDETKVLSTILGADEKSE